MELWWLSIVFVLLIEVEQKKADEVYKKKDLIQLCIQVGLVLYMRDSLVLMVVTFVVRSEKVRKIVFNKIL